MTIHASSNDHYGWYSEEKGLVYQWSQSVATLTLGPPAPDGDIIFDASSHTTLWFMYRVEDQLQFGSGSVRWRLAVAVGVLPMASLERHGCI